MNYENQYKAPSSNLGVSLTTRYTWKNHALAIFFCIVIFPLVNELLFRMYGFINFNVSIFYHKFEELQTVLLIQAFIWTFFIVVVFVSVPILLISRYRKVNYLIVIFLAAVPGVILLTFVYNLNDLIFIETAVRTIIISVVYTYFFRKKIA